MNRIIAILAVVGLASLPGLGLADEAKEHVCFRALDADRDGVVTLEEFKTFYPDGETLFGEADANRDGKLTHDEYHDLLGHGSS